jgi:hypothetical protein
MSRVFHAIRRFLRRRRGPKTAEPLDDLQREQRERLLRARRVVPR